MSGNKALKGNEKAAVVISAMGQETATEIMKTLREEEIESLTAAFYRVRKLSKEQVDEVIKDFSNKIDLMEETTVADDDFIQRAVEKALGPEKAKELLGRSNDSYTGIDSLKRLDPKTIANFIKGEHPQTLALILTNIDPDQASQIMPLLPEGIQAEVMLRMATMEGVPHSVLKEVEEVLKFNFQDAVATRERHMGGLDVVANILNMVDKSSEERIMNEIEAKNTTLAENIRKLMFVFDDLANVDDRSMQSLLKEISTDDLGIALKSASEEVKQVFLKNMSERAAQILQEDMEAKGPVRLAEVERAQQAIIKIARNLEAEGKMILGKGGEEIAY